MRVAYVQGYDGVTGPLLLAACLDAGVDLPVIQDGWRALHLPDAQVAAQRIADTNAAGLQVTFAAPDVTSFIARHPYTSLGDFIAQRPVAPRVKQGLCRMVTRCVSAMARVHGVPEEDIALLTEVLYLGSGVAFALDALGVDQVIAAPLPLASGVRNVEPQRSLQPSPLTAELCRGVPIYGHPSNRACTTAAGAAILTGLATTFGPLPHMVLTTTGYGTTAEHPPSPQLRVFLGEAEGEASAERITVMEANIDDMNPEFYESIFARLFAQGALDVTLTPLFMKKNRPANTLTVLAPPAAVATLARAILQETSTFGVRMYEVWRQKLARFHRDVDTRYGTIAVKCGVLDGRIVQAAPEYDACKHAAETQGVPVRMVYAEAARLSAPWLGQPSIG